MPVIRYILNPYSLAKRIFITGYKYLKLYWFLAILITSILTTSWLILNGGLISITESRDSTVNLKLKEPVLTNFSAQDFDESYVKPEEYHNYNRVWDSADISVQSSEEIFVMTNVIISANQTQGRCPESPLLRGAICDPNNNHCVRGRKLADGIETGSCVPGDFPHHDGKGNWTHGYDCEVIGWCPARRLLPPLKGYAGVLADTKNNTLWFINTIKFNDYDMDFDNLLGVNESHINCRYNPETEPRCPIFILGDILKYSKNNNLSYEEVAKFGATITLQIEWKCRLPLFTEFDSINDCHLKYSFLKTVNGSYTYRNKFYYNHGKTRTHWMAYGLRIKVNVVTKLERYNIFQFISYSIAYTGVYSAVIYGFEYFVRLYLNRRGHNIDELIDFQPGPQPNELNEPDAREMIPLI